MQIPPGADCHQSPTSTTSYPIKEPAPKLLKIDKENRNGKHMKSDAYHQKITLGFNCDSISSYYSKKHKFERPRLVSQFSIQYKLFGKKMLL